MKITTVICVSILFLHSCISSTKPNGTDESLDLQNLEGGWKGVHYSWYSDIESGEGILDFDLFFKGDSVIELKYPLCINESCKYTIVSDSIVLPFYRNERKYKWTIKNDLLTLTGNYVFNGQNSTDSLIFKRDSFNSELIGLMTTEGFNRNHLESNKWKFDINNTRKYQWKEYDTTLYSPPKFLEFSTTGDYYVGKNKVKFNSDTFRISSLSETWMILNYNLDSSVISLNYTAVVEN